MLFKHSEMKEWIGPSPTFYEFPINQSCFILQGGELREKADMYRGMGAPTPRSDPFEAFRKNKAGSFYTRMKDREKDRSSDRKSGAKK